LLSVHCELRIMSNKIIIAGGGTGGHIFPAIAIANALQKLQPAVKILFVGAKGKMEMEKVPRYGYDIVGLDIAGYNRSSLIKNVGLPFKILKSFFQVRKILSDFQPDAVVGVGGYSTYPMVRYAQQKGIRTFIHESNSFPGKSNKMLGRRATKIFVATEGMGVFFPKDKIVITGNPVRSVILNNTITRDSGVQSFHLDPDRKTVLSIGGSLGARSINEAIATHIDEFSKNGLQLIWQTGKPFIEKGKEAAAGKSNIWVGEFITEMEYAYAAADVVISRAGAMAIAELCVVAKPVLFVPYPFAAEDHQTVNARALVLKNAALMIPDAETREKLVASIVALANDETVQQTFKTNISKLAFRDADIRVATEVLKLINMS
jgi:UDP-N-acetylglucosamine--N-acetylmuramyl-(pentapeptide) pyrophosphoryl-undecaprenol N-acetylglucosamine transferase